MLSRKSLVWLREEDRSVPRGATHRRGSGSFPTDSSWVPGSDLGWRALKVGMIAPALTFTSLTHFQGQDLNSMSTIPNTVLLIHSQDSAQPGCQLACSPCWQMGFLIQKVISLVDSPSSGLTVHHSVSFPTQTL